MKIDFPLGVSSSAFQIEGGWNSDGKGESIWDRWLHIPGKGAATGDVSTDHYHRWEEDVELLRELGVDSYRFSVSWPRVMPDGEGRVNAEGLAFYKNLVSRLKEYGISPAVTLYHWDLPQKLQDQGGWANRNTAKAFQVFAEVMFEALGDAVDVWITHNEPFVAAYMGHANGRFAPGHTDISEALAVSHNILLSHGLAVWSFRKGKYKGKIGITLDFYPSEPASDTTEDILAAKRDRDSHLGWFADPVFFGQYPQEMWDWYARKGVTMPQISPGDMRIIAQPLDFLGINYYRPSTIRHCEGNNWPYDNAYAADLSEKDNALFRLCPEALGKYLRYINDAYAPREIIITENGFSAVEAPDRHGRIQDHNRIDYLYRHLEQCILARQSGVPIAGYYVWCFLDDLEWTAGYKTRMGLVRVDYDTMKRTIKESGYWYKRVIQNRKLVD